jgi:hypothetical protein
MQVTACKTVEIETEVEIDTDDIIREFSARQDEATATYWRRLVPALDAMTRIMANIPDEVIAAMPDAACETLCERLMDQAMRYDRAV